MRIAVPAFFLADGVLGENHDPEFDKPTGWIDYYGNLWQQNTELIFKRLNGFFISSEEDENLPQNSCTTFILYSLALRYFDKNKNQSDENEQYIIWNYKFIKVGSSAELPARQKPFTILTVADKEGLIEKNLIYGPTGEGMFWIDFDSHSKSRPGCLHIIPPGNLYLQKDEKHSFEPETLPWVWLAISFDEELEAPIFKSGEMFRFPYEVITVECKQNHINPKFEGTKKSPSPADYINLCDITESVCIREELRVKKATRPEPHNMWGSLYATVKSYTPYLVTLGLFYAAHRACEKLGVYHDIQNRLTRRNP